jgi:predicted RNA-binding Zn-ribbon protein involved in translation (DUF1610 family)
MRLINADELKEKFDDYIKANPNISGVFELGKFIIDNAPTVELCKDCDGYEAGYNAGIKETERPQGEWVYRVNGFSNMSMEYCSICNFPTPIYLDKPNFCPNCGAQMKTRTKTD